MIQVCRAIVSDVEAVAAVLRDSFLDLRPLYSEAAYAATTPDADTLCRRLDEGPIWVAIFRGRIAGPISAVEKPDGVYVRSAAVTPADRGNHITEALVGPSSEYVSDALE